MSLNEHKLKEEKTMIELKKCPFCDGEAQVLHGGLAFMAAVECKDCGARVDVVSEKDDPVLLAIMKWNRRAGIDGD